MFWQILRDYEDVTVENTALKAEVAGLKTRLTDAYELCNKETRRCEAHQKELNRLTDELIRRGAGDPWEPKPPCDTAFAALQAVCKWDRDECVADLRKQRAESLRRLDAVLSGRELLMDHVTHSMNKDNQTDARMWAWWSGASLHSVLRRLRDQLSTIFDSIESHGSEGAHQEWFNYPLREFRQAEIRQDRDPDDEIMEV